MVILTDLSEVLISGFYGIENILGDRFAVSPEGKAALAKKLWERHLVTNHVFLELLRGKITEDEYWQEFFQGEQWVFGLEEAKAAFSANMRHVIPGTLELYQRITRHPHTLTRGYYVYGRPTVYIVSDHIDSRINEIKAEHPDIFRVATDQFWSCDIGMVKQDPGFFAWLLDETGLDPGEVIFIDDNATNVLAALNVGIAGIKFENYRQLEVILREQYDFAFAPEEDF